MFPPNEGERRTRLDAVVDGFESSATGGKAFAMERVRTFEGERVDFGAAVMSPFPQPADEEMCEQWAVLTSIFEPTKTVKQLANLSGWCVVVVGDKNGGFSDVSVVSIVVPTAIPSALTYETYSTLCTPC